MRVTPDSPVQDKDSYLFQWDTAARRYFSHFEIHKNSAREGLRKLFQNFLTRNRDPIQYEQRFRAIDAIVTRQLLGEISSDEISELNSIVGSPNGTFFLGSNKEPASLWGWKIYPLLGLWAVCSGIAVYTRFIKGYNNLWLIAGYVPMWSYLIYGAARQPNQEIQNAYNYLLAKRAATCELQANTKKFNQNEFTKSEQYKSLRQALEARNITLYQLEAELVEKVNAGTIK
jgi:hypothetical protein